MKTLQFKNNKLQYKSIKIKQNKNDAFYIKSMKIEQYHRIDIYNLSFY